MNHFETAYAQRLSKRIADADANRMKSLRSGAMDESAYKEAVGYLKALDNVSEWMQEIEHELKQGK